MLLLLLHERLLLLLLLLLLLSCCCYRLRWMIAASSEQRDWMITRGSVSRVHKSPKFVWLHIHSSEKLKRRGLFEARVCNGHKNLRLCSGRDVSCFMPGIKGSCVRMYPSLTGRLGDSFTFLCNSGTPFLNSTLPLFLNSHFPTD
jgi:hypothetical protein